ncbi:hypothetical protein [Devosia indica]
MSVIDQTDLRSRSAPAFPIKSIIDQIGPIKPITDQNRTDHKNRSDFSDQNRPITQFCLGNQIGSGSGSAFSDQIGN